MKRFMSLSLPLWPTERRHRRPAPARAPAAPRCTGSAAPDDPARPFALVHSTAGGERLYALDAEAARRGLALGQALASAKAIEPTLVIDSATPETDRRLLAAFARGCGRWSPWTAPDPGAPGEDGVLLEVTGCAHLFGGEPALLAEVIARCRAQGLSAHAAIAPTLGLAWALARHAAPRRAEGWVLTDTVQPVLDTLPVEGLRIGDTAARLHRFGLRRVGDIARIPRAQLARRFGRELVRRLDQARGSEAESLAPLQPKTALRARLHFAEPLLLLDGLKQAVANTAGDLARLLETHGLGLLRVELHLYRVDGKTHLLSLGLAAPARDAKHVSRLFEEKLDRAEIDIGFGIETVELVAREARRLDGRQSALTGGDAVEAEDLAVLTDRLSVRLGDRQVQRVARRQSHQPERAARWHPGGPPLAVAETGPPALRPITAERPLLVLTRPEPAEAVAEIPDGPPRSFVWRRVRHLVHRAEGPERLAPDWWRASPESPARTRDYFRVETVEGRRFWLFRDGLYALETRTPRWFVHGAS
ncbi:DUF6504 family protein [Maricaulis sp. CAU 1757]